MRRFEVWCAMQVAGVEPSTCVVELRDGATDEDVEDACRAALDSIIENNFDTGWRELPREAAPRSARRKR